MLKRNGIKWICILKMVQQCLRDDGWGKLSTQNGHGESGLLLKGLWWHAQPTIWQHQGTSIHPRDDSHMLDSPFWVPSL